MIPPHVGVTLFLLLISGIGLVCVALTGMWRSQRATDEELFESESPVIDYRDYRGY